MDPQVRTRETYAEALHAYVCDGEEGALLRAYELGRLSMGRGSGILDIVDLHAAALDSLLSEGGIAAERGVMRGGEFLAEVLSPFEMGYRGFQEANEQLHDAAASLEEAVEMRTGQLEASLDALARMDRQRQELLTRLVEAQEEERRRIAADIHDDSIQVVSALGLRLGILRTRVRDPDDVQLVRNLEDTVRQAVARLRHLTFELRPPELDRAGLAAALQAHLEHMADPGFSHEVIDRLDEEPSSAVRTVLYRIAQEALVNIRKHAAAAHVKVLISSRAGGVAVRVRDDGAGFDVDEHVPRRGHVGLTAMRERAAVAGGWCRVSSTPGEGTAVTAWVPTDASAEARVPAERATP